MSVATAKVVFGGVQTNHGIVVAPPPGIGEYNPDDRPQKWPEHVAISRMFYLWALDNPEGHWARGESGLLRFTLLDTWALYELAHSGWDADESHWNLLDCGPNPMVG